MCQCQKYANIKLRDGSSSEKCLFRRKLPREGRQQLSQQKRNYARYAFGNLSVGVQYAWQTYLLQSSFIHAQTTFLLRIWNTSLPIQLRSGQSGWTLRALMLRAQNMTTRNWYLRLKHFLQSFGGD